MKLQYGFWPARLTSMSGQSIKRRENMTDSHPGRSQPDEASAITLGEIVKDAIRYWEVRRIGYTLVLISVTLAWLVFTWPHFRPAFTWQAAVIMLVLATLANVCYCAAYLVDIVFQRINFSFAWRSHRWILWGAGTLFAACLAHYWIGDEIYPFV
jgi:hypothetical protein